MMTSAGQSACAAQDDVLQCCDQLYINSKITENQLLYLRHLVLIRDEDVAQLYDDFQEHQSQDKLLRDLFRLANTHPRLGQEEEDDEDDEEEEEDEAEEQWAALQREQQRRRQQEDNLLNEQPPPKKNPYSRQASQERAAARKQQQSQSQREQETGDIRHSPAARTSTLNGLLSMMLRTGDVSPVEAMLLNHMIASDHEIICAAYDLYQSDGDLTELQDTMMRCAKLEMRRRNEEIEKQQRAIDATGERDETRRALLQKYGAEVDEDDSEVADSGEEEQDDDDDDGQLAPGGDELLTEMLGSMGVDNAWQGTVPPRFILAVFAAAQRRLLTVGQSRALCDLYQAQYDLVRAAWEVFNVQGDVVDFTDTLRRIVRDLNFREDGNVRMSQGPSETAAARPSTSRGQGTQSEAQVMEAVREGQAQTQAAENGRADALAAVAAAKRELLKHSLEIMVKQGLVTTAAATGLYERALRGDPLTDAAIDSYAADRDIMEFLDTLQILANNSPEDLDNIMRMAMEEDGDDEDDDDDDVRADESNRENSSPSLPEEDDDEEEDETVGDMDQAQKELRNLILKLSRENIISKDVHAILLKLIVSRDDRIMAAHDVYRDFGDEEDLVDSLLRIARKERTAGYSRKASDDGGIEMSDISRPARKKAPEEKGVEVEMTRFRHDDDDDDDDDVEMPDLVNRGNTASNDDDDDDDDDDESPGGLLNSGDQKSILEILAKYVIDYMCFYCSVT